MNRPVLFLLLAALAPALDQTRAALPPGPEPVVLQTPFLEFRLARDTGAFEIADRRGQVTWWSSPQRPRFGTATLIADGKRQLVALTQPEIQRTRSSLRLTFRPAPQQPQATLRVVIQSLADGQTLDFSYQADRGLNLESLRLLDEALWVSRLEEGYVVVPVREGLLIPADSGVAFTRTFDTYAYEGCHQTMLGVAKRGAIALITWQDPYVAAEVKSTLSADPAAFGGQALFPSLVLRRSAASFRVQFLGRGDYVTLGKAYRAVAQDQGWVVPWARKLPGHPERARLFGAINYKLWSTLDRTMNEDSTAEERAHVNWTFDEAAQIAEHLKRDLQLDRVLFLMGGWIRRGYDNQHPDILPAAPECGGDAGLADCSRRVRQLGYLFGLHDNYQDMYRDAPSWNEDYLTRNADGSIAKGGRWAGGRAYLTCSQKAVELARREQNLPAVKRLTQADAYFIDTTYAAGLMECHDARHPLTRADDRHWKQVISDYARGEFGIFGSECGREWALPHADFFEGLTGVSGGAYHDAGLLKQTGGVVIPLFELVYRDGIALYGKYGYDIHRSADYVLQHLALGRTLNYHNVPAHLYWREVNREPDAVAVEPCVPAIELVSPRELRISYQWIVEQTPKEDWQVFVHFTDSEGKILFQNDHTPRVPTSQWLPSRIESLNATLALPERAHGSVEVWIGLFQPSTGRRALLPGDHDGSRRYRVGRLEFREDRLRLVPARSLESAPDPGTFVRADDGWAAGLHPFDRFVKNTYEVLSPLNELTSQLPMTRHEFLTRDRTAQRSVFGQGPAAVEVVVNAGPGEFKTRSRLGGEVRLPPNGFLVEAPTFVAFHARSWNGLRYDRSTLFSLRSRTGKPLERASAVRIFHGFGDPRLRWQDRTLVVEKERTVGTLTP